MNINKKSNINKSRAINVAFNKVDLWLQNQRHGQEFNTQEEALNWFINGHWNELFKTIKSICEEKGLYNKLKVVKDKDRYYIIDGNTRFSAIQLINNPQLCNDEKKQKSIEKVKQGDIFNNGKLEVELFNESEIDQVIYHEHVDGIKKGIYNPYRQADIKGSWISEISQYFDNTKYIPPVYLLQRYLTKKRANHIGINFDNKKKLISEITEDVKSNIIKLQLVIENNPKGQISKKVIDTLFDGEFKSKTDIKQKSDIQQDLLGDVVDLPKGKKLDESKPKRRKSDLNNKENINKKEDFNSYMKDVIDKLSDSNLNDKIIYTSFIEIRDINLEKYPNMSLIYLRTLLDVCYRQLHQDNKLNNDNKGYYNELINEFSKENSNDAKSAHKFKDNINSIVHGQKTICNNDFYTYFNSLVPVFDYAIDKICSKKDEKN